MPRQVVHVATADGEELRQGFAAIREELKLPGCFPADVLAEAEAAVDRLVLPDVDETGVPLVTLDPPGSLDLDQAMHIERRGDGYRVYYAIADVAAFVKPGGALDNEAHTRVETLYLPDGNVPLHPTILCEDAASLLPGQDRPALLWTIDLDSSGESTHVGVRRAHVRSRAKLDYPTVQAQLDAGTAPEVITLLREVGLLRQERERRRGGVDLRIPEQEVVGDGDSWRLEYRANLPVEGWNAQISLLTGMAAAKLMLHGEIGILRTLPEPPPWAYNRIHRVAHALDIPWPQDTPYGEVIRSLDSAKPAHAAFLQEATVLLRGAGYTAFDGGVPEQAVHAAVASEYAHVTAPLRRLVDRYASEVCVSLCAGVDVPEWARTALPKLPATMEAGDRRAHQVERSAVDLVEAVLLQNRVGGEFDAMVIELNQRIDADGNGKADSGTIQLLDPAVRGRCDGHDLPLGADIRARLVRADPVARSLRFERV